MNEQLAAEVSGAIRDNRSGKWYVEGGQMDKILMRWYQDDISLLNVPQDESEEAMSQGAIWDEKKQKWYVKSIDMKEELARWYAGDENDEFIPYVFN